MITHKLRLLAWLASLLTLASLGGCDSSSVVGGTTPDAAANDLGVDVACPGAATLCGGSCVDTQTDRNHCGDCATACPGPQVCVAGRCAVACPGTQRVCDNACVSVETDRLHCGACGNACPSGQVCAMGRCALDCGATLAMCDAGDAGVGDAGTSRYCANTRTDNSNCGGCGVVCAPGTACQDGRCAVSCALDQTLCAGACRDLQTDTRHCGACGNACPTGNVCAAGACVLSCAAGLTTCGGACANLMTDNANCGACGTACPSGSVCSGGACGTTCAAPLATCGAAPSAFCANTAIDPANCGRCGNACALPNAMTLGCTDGSCAVVRCNAGFGDCDGVASNGCETDTRTTASSCGACGRACALPNATATCAAGACAIGACAAGFADCDMNPANGCETDTRSDNASCGMCGRACAAGSVCSMGACGTTCASPLTTCGAGSSAFCANTAVDPVNCGGCGVSCALAGVAAHGCASGACTIVRCNSGRGDCDGVASNGCETNTLTASESCGACGRTCALPNATTACTAGVCGITACAAGFADCDMNPANGCETDTRTDNASCGACGRACAAGSVCSGGACSTTCASPLATCGSGATAFCANTAIDPDNCGRCGNVCALAHAAASGCAAGGCTVLRCDVGFGNCDNASGNGCESTFATDNANCGGCGRACIGGQTCAAGACVCPSGQTLCGGVCVSTVTSALNCGACGNACALPNATSSCAASACAVTACATGFANCDGSAANGCETNTQIDGDNCGMCGRACAAGTVCSRGVCGTTCASPLATCGSGATAYCANTAIDPANCGMCGRVCALPNASSNGCAAGACTVAGCSAGFGDCDATASNGCETNTQTSASNCGACGRVCALPNASSTCSAGACAIGACATGFADCDGVAANGCETDTRSDNASCGMCRRACAAGSVCSGGVCGTTCASPLTTCGSGSSAFCANTSIDPTNCGMCGRVCALPNAASNGCAGGACTIAGCNAGFGDCDATASNGCETNTQTTAAHCGACGRTCNLPNASSTCSAGACAIGTCTTGFANCDANPANGCETNTRTDNANCGGCGVACATGSVCAAGVCASTCVSPLTTCGSVCTNRANDPLNCGTCGNVCTAGTNATPACSAGVCGDVCVPGAVRMGSACVFSSTTVTFPSSGSVVGGPDSPGTLGSGGGGVRYQNGDFVSETFTRTTPVTSLRLTFTMSDFTNSFCTVGTLSWNVIVNGVVVGTYTFPGGLGAGTRSFDRSYTFAAIAPSGSSVTLRLEATTTVCSGAGSWNWFPGGTAVMQ